MSCNVLVPRAAEKQIAAWSLCHHVRISLYDFLVNELPQKDNDDFAEVRWTSRTLLACGHHVVDPGPPPVKHLFVFHFLPDDEKLVLLETGHMTVTVFQGPHSTAFSTASVAP